MCFRFGVLRPRCPWGFKCEHAASTAAAMVAGVVGSGAFCPRVCRCEGSASATAGWRVAGSVVCHWGQGHDWVPSATAAMGRGTVAVLAAEVGPQLGLGRLHALGEAGGAAAEEFPKQQLSASFSL